MILPIIMICVCLIMGGGVLLYIKLLKKNGTNKKSQETDPAAVTANEFVNVRDISGKFLYARDNMVLAYLRIMPISIDLFSKSEKQQIVRQLTANLSSADYPFQLIAVSRPVDISPLLSELSDTLTACGDGKQKAYHLSAEKQRTSPRLASRVSAHPRRLRRPILRCQIRAVDTRSVL